jgi:uncharacterized membrane protein
MSFVKKLSLFLNAAEDKNLINNTTNKKLRHFAQTNKTKSGIGSLLNIIGFFGGITVILGLILVISHNWSTIPNTIKILAYITTLLTFHFAAYKLHDSHQRIAHILHFIGAGYVIAGIGLIAQIYHLSSNDGRAFLLWSILITPLAIILKHKWIGVMVMFSFYTWIHINLGVHYNSFVDIRSSVVYFTTISTSMILIPLFFKLVNNCFDHVRFFGIGILMILTFTMGFSHELINHKTGAMSIDKITIGILITNLLILIYLSARDHKHNNSLFLSTAQIAIILSVINLVPFLIQNIPAIIISILYWVIWFYFSVIIIYQGITQENKAMINFGTWGIIIGIIIRFTDIIGTMLFTGSMFILLGTILVIITFIAERFLHNTINKMTSEHAK